LHVPGHTPHWLLPRARTRCAHTHHTHHHIHSNNTRHDKKNKPQKNNNLPNRAHRPTKQNKQVTRQVFEAAKGRLKVVGRAGVGVDNVDLAAATEHGCLVVNAPTANTVAAAEHGIALLCALARNVAQADASMKAAKWERSKYVGVSMVDKTLAIMGFGKVGGEVARRAKGLGMTVLAHDPYASEEKARAVGVQLVSLDDALARADFFSLHMPLTPGECVFFLGYVLDVVRVCVCVCVALHTSLPSTHA
jgi:phosphoglycerate dehydrogenase-like enzyme